MSGQPQEEEKVWVELTRSQYDVLDYLFRSIASESTLDAVMKAFSLGRLEAADRMMAIGNALTRVSTVMPDRMTAVERWIWVIHYAAATGGRHVRGAHAAIEAGRAVLRFRELSEIGEFDADDMRRVPPLEKAALAQLLAEVKAWR